MIGCTRCGATCEGDIILPPLAFGFKHNAGCGHGVGPLAVLPGSAKSKKEKKDDISEIESKPETSPKEQPGDVIVEEKPKKSKFKVFKREKKDG